MVLIIIVGWLSISVGWLLPKLVVQNKTHPKKLICSKPDGPVFPLRVEAFP